MELKNFITTVITEIIDGVEAAQSVKGFDYVNPSPRGDTKMSSMHDAGFYLSAKTGLVQLVEFDVAVTAMDGKASKGGIGIFVATIGLGAQGQSQQSSSVVSRIKFKVPLSLPAKIPRKPKPQLPDAG